MPDSALPLGWLVWVTGPRRGVTDVLRIGVNAVDPTTGTGAEGAYEIIADDLSGALRIRPRDASVSLTVDAKECVEERRLTDRARIALDGEEAVLVALCRGGFSWEPSLDSDGGA